MNNEKMTHICTLFYCYILVIWVNQLWCLC